jgi:hypothetical protein
MCMEPSVKGCCCPLATRLPALPVTRRHSKLLPHLFLRSPKALSGGRRLVLPPRRVAVSPRARLQQVGSVQPPLVGLKQRGLAALGPLVQQLQRRWVLVGRSRCSAELVDSVRLLSGASVVQKRLHSAEPVGVGLALRLPSGASAPPLRLGASVVRGRRDSVGPVGLALRRRPAVLVHPPLSALVRLRLRAVGLVRRGPAASVRLLLAVSVRLLLAVSVRRGAVASVRRGAVASVGQGPSGVLGALVLPPLVALVLPQPLALARKGLAGLVHRGQVGSVAPGASVRLLLVGSVQRLPVVASARAWLVASVRLPLVGLEHPRPVGSADPGLEGSLGLSASVHRLRQVASVHRLRQVASVQHLRQVASVQHLRQVASVPRPRLVERRPQSSAVALPLVQQLPPPQALRSLSLRCGVRGQDLVVRLQVGVSAQPLLLGPTVRRAACGLQRWRRRSASGLAGVMILICPSRGPRSAGVSLPGALLLVGAAVPAAAVVVEAAVPLKVLVIAAVLDLATTTQTTGRQAVAPALAPPTPTRARSTTCPSLTSFPEKNLTRARASTWLSQREKRRRRDWWSGRPTRRPSPK